ncbi:hypothetical protein FPV67DRAFT_1132241 [Lyophyllum atratum]|nr:hypothetical protein FPV67DRAFT_1132241 [Lyophyllum atratum]
MPQLLDLPPETIVRILCYLDLQDLVSVTRTSRALHSINAFQVLQYRFALQAAGLEDNPDSSLVVAERLALLKNREEGWSNFSFDFRTTLPIQHMPSGIYDMTGGIYLLGDVNKRTLHYCKLPSKPSDPLTWSRIDIDRPLVDMGLSIYEHDLIAIVTTSPHPTHFGMHVIEVLLLEFSTGKPHPLARIPVLSVVETHWPRPAIGIEIVGDHLALVLTYYVNHEHAPRDRFYIFDWKTGTLKMDLPALHHTYSGLVFLSPTLVLLPNARKHCLDIWSIPPSPLPSPPRPVLSLCLPPLNLGQFILSLSCRGEPNPTLAGTPHSDQPFHAAPEDALILFNLRVGHAIFPLGNSFSMFVHRSALLRLAHQAQSIEGAAAVGAELFEGEMVLVQGAEMPETNIPEPEAREDEAGPPGVFMEWKEWGPGVTRWLNAEDMPTRWITTSAGQRCVISTEDPEAGMGEDEDEDEEMEEEEEEGEGEEEEEMEMWGWHLGGPGIGVGIGIVGGGGGVGAGGTHTHTTTATGPGAGRGPPLTVLDFNPLTIRRLFNTRGPIEEREHDAGGGRRTRMEVVRRWTRIETSVFKDPVESALPYVSFTCWPPRGERFDFAGVLMDEERLLGLRVRFSFFWCVGLCCVLMGLGGCVDG